MHRLVHRLRGKAPLGFDNNGHTSSSSRLPSATFAMTAVLRHVQGFPLFRLLPPLRHTVTTSVAADPVCLVFDYPPGRPMTVLPTFT
jgi:hypothetical protein